MTVSEIAIENAEIVSNSFRLSRPAEHKPKMHKTLS